jgi:hypothetical protein
LIGMYISEHIALGVILQELIELDIACGQLKWINESM